MKELMNSILTFEVLLAITFVFGVLHLLTLTKLFDSKIGFISNIIFPKFNLNQKNRYGLLGFLVWIKDGIVKLWYYLGMLFFYFSLCFQAWYWLFR